MTKGNKRSELSSRRFFGIDGKLIRNESDNVKNFLDHVRALAKDVDPSKLKSASGVVIVEPSESRGTAGGTITGTLLDASEDLTNMRAELDQQKGGGLLKNLAKVMGATGSGDKSGNRLQAFNEALEIIAFEMARENPPKLMIKGYMETKTVNDNGKQCMATSSTVSQDDIDQRTSNLYADKEVDLQSARPAPADSPSPPPLVAPRPAAKLPQKNIYVDITNETVNEEALNDVRALNAQKQREEALATIAKVAQEGGDIYEYPLAEQPDIYDAIQKAGNASLDLGLVVDDGLYEEVKKSVRGDAIHENPRKGQVAIYDASKGEIVAAAENNYMAPDPAQREIYDALKKVADSECRLPVPDDDREAGEDEYELVNTRVMQRNAAKEAGEEMLSRYTKSGGVKDAAVVGKHTKAVLGDQGTGQGRQQ